jgi:HlyD family secretion protein
MPYRRALRSPRAVTLLGLALAGLVACSEGGAPPSDARRGGSGGGPPRQPPAVEAVEVHWGSFPLEERLSGLVRARNQTDIFAEVTGTIAAVHADNGDQVRAGDPLVQLRARDFEERVRQAESGLQIAAARVRQAEANLFRAETSLDRIETIVERGLGAAAELDTARADAIAADADLALMRAQHDQAAALLEEQQVALDEALVRAPIDGIVGGRNAEVGQQASASSSLFTIGDIDSMQVDIVLTQQMLAYIGTGTTVRIYSDATPDQVLEAKITRISPFLDSITHTTRAEIHISEHGDQLRPGMFVTVDVLYGESEQASLVPNSSIYRHPRGGQEGVFVAALDEALRDPETSELPSLPSGQEPIGPVSVRFVPIEVVARGRQTSAIRGVEPGNWVVTLGHHLLANEEQQAIVQPTPWEHILDLQLLQSRHLIEIIREKQQKTDSRSLIPN